MKTEDILQILESDCIDDPEELLDWLGTEGVTVLAGFQRLQTKTSELIQIFKDILDEAMTQDAFEDDQGWELIKKAEESIKSIESELIILESEQ